MPLRPIPGRSVVELLDTYPAKAEFVVSVLRVLTFTPDHRLVELWESVERKERPTLPNEQLCAILQDVDQIIDLYIHLDGDEGIYLDIDDGDVIDNDL